ncbi:GTP-binding protein [Demequina sediminicola]|uniref:GTP-binding protein n=1 Tax=Demequina sediminicola TaxID=1095026 RepID=UPI0007832075|nr:ATP/GTP-binding protein [Demequina sediminicola]
MQDAAHQVQSTPQLNGTPHAVPVSAVPVHKIVVSGPFGAGKTTFVSTVCANALGAEQVVSDKTSRVKEQTTVALDHGTAQVPTRGGQRAVTLFGTPGQERFSFMWPILGLGMVAYILMVDVSRLQSQAQLKGIMKRFAYFAPQVPFVVAANRWSRTAISAPDLARFIGVDSSALVHCDPRDSEESKAVLAHTLELADARTNAESPGSHGHRRMGHSNGGRA